MRRSFDRSLSFRGRLERHRLLLPGFLGQGADLFHGLFTLFGQTVRAHRVFRILAQLPQNFFETSVGKGTNVT